MHIRSIIYYIIACKRNAIIDLLYYSNLVGKNGRDGEKEKEKERRKRKKSKRQSSW